MNNEQLKYIGQTLIICTRMICLTILAVRGADFERHSFLEMLCRITVAAFDPELDAAVRKGHELNG